LSSCLFLFTFVNVSFEVSAGKISAVYTRCAPSTAQRSVAWRGVARRGVVWRGVA